MGSHLGRLAQSEAASWRVRRLRSRFSKRYRHLTRIKKELAELTEESIERARHLYLATKHQLLSQKNAGPEDAENLLAKTFGTRRSSQ
jgi:hypothetical protein